MERAWVALGREQLPRAVQGQIRMDGETGGDGFGQNEMGLQRSGASCRGRALGRPEEGWLGPRARLGQRSRRGVRGQGRDPGGKFLVDLIWRCFQSSEKPLLFFVHTWW